MTDKELRKLGRSDLLEILLAQSKEISELKENIRTLTEQLEDRTIKYESAGSLAEAVVNVSGIIDAAQRAADLYLDNIRNSTSDISEAQKKCAEIEAKSKSAAKSLLDKTAAECRAMREETEKICAEMLKKAEGKN